MYRLADPDWWRSIAAGLMRTLIAALAPIMPALIADPRGEWRHAGMFALFAVVGALATSLAALPDPSGTWWQVGLQRAARQGGQVVVAAAASAVLLSDLDWYTVLATAAWSSLATFILAAMSLGVDPTPGSDADLSAAVAALTNPASTDTAGDIADIDDDLTDVSEDLDNLGVGSDGDTSPAIDPDSPTWAQ